MNLKQWIYNISYIGYIGYEILVTLIHIGDRLVHVCHLLSTMALFLTTVAQGKMLSPSCCHQDPKPVYNPEGIFTNK